MSGFTVASLTGGTLTAWGIDNLITAVTSNDRKEWNSTALKFAGAVAAYAITAGISQLPISALLERNLINLSIAALAYPASSGVLDLAKHLFIQKENTTVVLKRCIWRSAITLIGTAAILSNLLPIQKVAEYRFLAWTFGASTMALFTGIYGVREITLGDEGIIKGMFALTATLALVESIPFVLYGTFVPLHPLRWL